MRAPLVTLPLAAAALLAALLPPAPAQAADAPSFTGPGVVAEGPDFPSEAYADPWDYANPQDMLVDRGPVINATVTGVSGGRLRFTASRPAHLSLVFPGYDGSLPVGREGLKQPIPAAGYTHASLRLYASARGPGGLSWQGCGVAAPCRNGHLSFTVEPGWHTYRLTLAGQGNWSGAVTGVRLAVSPSSAISYELDWVRLYRQAGPDVEVAASGTPFWDADADRANNTAGNPGWGRLPSDGKRWMFRASAYPPGTYRFFQSDSGYSAPLEVRATPRVVFEAPSEAGGEDYATARLGDPWDMNAPSDARVGNAQQVAWAGGVLHATNGPPDQNDPFVLLRQAGLIDTGRYHRLEVRTDYDGPFGLEDAPGGGMHGRLIWSRSETPTVWEDSKEFVTYSTVDRYVIDLHTPVRADVADDESRVRHGWVGHLSRLRWDPNEDRGARRWRIDGIWLRADHEARGPFDVRWHDTTGNAGVKVSLYADRDRSGYDGVLLEPDVAQTAGGTAYRWSARSLPSGTWHLYAVATDGVATGRSYAGGPLHVTQAPSPAIRVAGGDRIQTAVRLSQAAFPATASHVVIARDRDFPDALAAAPLAAAANGPLLLNPQDRLHDAVRAEVRRLGARTVYLMGGPVAQSASVEAALRADGVTVVRVAGSSRYATASAAAREAVRLWGGTAGEAPLLAGGTTFPDALAAGPLAAARRQPLLLTYPDAMPSETRQAVADFRARTVTVLGGEKAVATATVGQLGVPVSRIGGPSRYDTAVLAAQAALAAGARPGVVLAASGDTFADALAAGPSVAARDGLLLLVGREILPEVTHRFLDARAREVNTLRVAGGGAAVAEHVVGALADAADLP